MKNIFMSIGACAVAKSYPATSTWRISVKSCRKGAEREIVPITEPMEHAINRDSSLVSASVFDEALGEYCHR
jgi:hypothetical protein